MASRRFPEGKNEEGRYSLISGAQKMTVWSPKCATDNIGIENDGRYMGPSHHCSTSLPASPTDTYSSVESWEMARDFLNSGSPTFPKLDPIMEVNSTEPRYHHKRHQPTADGKLGDEWDIGPMRRRVNSMPKHHQYNKPAIELLTRQIRRFWITPKGILSQESQGRAVNNDTVSDHRAQMSASAIHQLGCDQEQIQHHKVLFLGSAGVGKRALIRLFANANDSEDGSFDDDSEKTVSIVLDGIESTIEFEDLSNQQVDLEVREEHADAYVVVYSVEDRRSYEASINRLLEIREVVGRHVALILVANKTDLVRSRVVTEEEGKTAAKTYDSKYIEVSAAIDLKIDELLVGVLQQIRLHTRKIERAGYHHTLLDSLHLHGARHNALTKMLKGRHQASKSCDNLYVL